jgi:carboxylesterase
VTAVTSTTTAFVLCHGFTGSPVSMEPWAQYLRGRGFDVDVPLLPGHGTTWQDLNTRKWPEFYETLERSYLGMAGRYERVFVGGLSMGGTLALRLAEQQHPAGLFLVNPALETARFDAKFAGPASLFVKSMPAIGDDIKKPGVTEQAYGRMPLRTFASTQGLWKITRQNLGAIDCPIVIFRSAEDHVVIGPATVDLIRRGVTKAPVEVVPLPNSYHVATLDNDAEVIFEGSASFAERA